MSATNIVALASPLVPVTLVMLVLRGHWWRGAVAPLQFTAFIGESVLAFVATRAVAQIVAGVGVMIALTGLVAIVFRELWFAHRADTAVFRWEDFERDYRAHVQEQSARRKGDAPY